MWDVSSAGIYTEDGNEMFNTLSPLPDPLACDPEEDMLDIFKGLLYLQACTRQQCHHLLLARKVLWSLGCTAEQCSRHLHAARLVWSIGSVEVLIQGTLLQFMGTRHVDRHI